MMHGEGDSPQTRYRLSMARTRKTQDEDFISQVADAGEDVLRRLVDLPRRAVVGVMDGVDERLHDVATKLRAIDPLARRVAALEERLESLEKPKKTTARRRSTRPSASTAAGQYVRDARRAGICRARSWSPRRRSSANLSPRRA